MPAEWEKHDATWLGWPHNGSDWPGKIGPIPWVYGEMVRRIAEGEQLRIIAPLAQHRREAKSVFRRAGVDPTQIEFARFPSDRGWLRDSGPVFVREKGGALRVARFEFTAWAKYRNWHRDRLTPPRAAQQLDLPVDDVMHNGRAVVLEGGSIDVNGQGTIVSTEECLLHPTVQVRNRGFRKTDYQAIFARALGASNTIWLGKGIVGDDTHGHVDDLCRFVNATTVVMIREKNTRDPNYRLLEENWERISTATLENGHKVQAVALPCPQPLYFDGRRLPASYANFYICNAAVLVPTFNDPADRIALGVLTELFRDRPVIGIHAVDLVWGLGTIHCLTQQQPAPRPP